jgi:hypothetical protein
MQPVPAWPTLRLRGGLLATVVAAVALIGTTGAFAEIIVLRQGGQIRGQWLNPERAASDDYIVRTVQGGTIRLERTSVQKVLRPSQAEQQYAERARACPDTVAGHAALAEWCAAQHLDRQRRAELERVIQLDGDNAAARQALGYRRVNDAWLTRDEAMAKRGLKRYAGQYRTAQDIALREEARTQRAAEGEWFKKIKRWRKWLVDDRPARFELAEQNMRAIDDPWAVPALVENLRREANRPIKLLLIDVLARIAAPTQAQRTDTQRSARSEALKALVAKSLYDPDAEVRIACLDALVDMHDPEVTLLYVRGLKSKDNSEVNLAAAALKALGDVSAVPPLIDALVTTHKFKIGSGNPGQTSASFSPGGEGGMGFGGGGGAKIVKAPVPNRQVHSALVALTGQNYEYRPRDWRAWYASLHRSRAINSRRD